MNYYANADPKRLTSVFGYPGLKVLKTFQNNLHCYCLQWRYKLPELDLRLFKAINSFKFEIKKLCDYFNKDLVIINRAVILYNSAVKVSHLIVERFKEIKSRLSEGSEESRSLADILISLHYDEYFVKDISHIKQMTNAFKQLDTDLFRVRSNEKLRN